jgi:hypothetical protein
MHQFKAQLDVTRKRTARLLPRQALTEKNVAWRKDFVREWFVEGSYNIDSIATKQEFDDQRPPEEPGSCRICRRQRTVGALRLCISISTC